MRSKVNFTDYLDPKGGIISLAWILLVLAFLFTGFYKPAGIVLALGFFTNGIVCGYIGFFKKEIDENVRKYLSYLRGPRGGQVPITARGLKF